MIPWTVMYLWRDAQESSRVGVGEVSAPHGAEDAASYAREKFGEEIVAMIPGSHMKKTYIFSDAHESGNSPFLHIDGETQKRSAI